MFTLMFGAFAVIALGFFCFGIYIFTAYVLSRLGKKFGVGSFPLFLIPVYDIMILCDCAKITRWLTVALVAPGIVTFVMNAVTFYIFAPVLEPASALVAVAAAIYLWGTIARRLGKNFWLWGIGTVMLMGLPVLIMAFDSSAPSHPQSSRRAEEEEKRYIDI